MAAVGPAGGNAHRPRRPAAGAAGRKPSRRRGHGPAQPPHIESARRSKAGCRFLPASYGVYAGRDSQLIELEPLPVEVPTSRARVSAEITKPSRATLPGDKLAFVVFRQNLADDIPRRSRRASSAGFFAP